MTERQPLSPRTRFEVFKRDNFTCRYCGKKTPEVVLEIDHVVAVANGGTNDPMNLVTSCYLCNRGKSDKPLSEMVTGEDPHDKAIELLEREQQLKEYECARRTKNERIIEDFRALNDIWDFRQQDRRFILSHLERFSRSVIEEALMAALAKTTDPTSFIKYYCGIMRNWSGPNGREIQDEHKRTIKDAEGKDI